MVSQFSITISSAPFYHEQNYVNALQQQSGSTDADMTKNDDCEEREMLSSEGDGKKKKSSKSPPLPCSPGYLVKDGITVELLGQGLWKRFYKLGTEMIITKAGR